MTYKEYQLILRQTSGLCTPLQADTLWGHFTGYLAQTKPELLNDFIQSYKDEKPAIIFSDGLPSLLKQDNTIEVCFPTPVDITLRIADLKEMKQLKKTNWLTKDDLERIIADNVAKDFVPKTPLEVVNNTQMRNQVSRTGEEDTKLFPLEEMWLNANEKKGTAVWSVFVKIHKDFFEQLQPFLEAFLLTGYGKKKNIGKGQFEITVKKVDELLFPKVQGANAFMSLSSFVPAEDDPVDGYWQTFTKYGKMGESAPLLNGHISENPFKSPIVMLKPGAVFKVSEGNIKQFYGVSNLNSTFLIRKEPDYIHPALAFVIPYRIK